MRRSVFWLLDQYAETGESVASIHATALRQAKLADELGFHSLWLAEHHFVPLGTVPNPAVVLAAIAQATTRLRVGPAVAVLPMRNPILIAEDYALVDVLSGGRLNMGVGTGSQPVEFTGMGADFEDRRAAYDAALSEICARWQAASGGVRGPEGMNVPPLQMPHPPIYVATGSVDGAYAAGCAGHSLLTLVSPAMQGLGDVEARNAAHVRGLADGGHAAESAESVVVAFAYVAATEEAAKATALPAMMNFFKAAAGIEPPDPDGMYSHLCDNDLALAGTPEQVAAQIERYAAIGVRHLAFVSRFGGMDAQAAEDNLRALAPAA